MYDENCLLQLGSNIRLLRCACKIKQGELAKRIRISQTHMSNIECNHVPANLKLMIRLANVLDCPLESLVTMKEAVKWAEEKCSGKVVQPRVSPNRGRNKQEYYSLEEVQRLLMFLSKS